MNFASLVLFGTNVIMAAVCIGGADNTSLKWAWSNALCGWICATLRVLKDMD